MRLETVPSEKSQALQTKGLRQPAVIAPSLLYWPRGIFGGGSEVFSEMAL